MPAKACHDFNNDFTLFTAVPVLFNMYTDKDSNVIREVLISFDNLSVLKVLVLHAKHVIGCLATATVIASTCQNSIRVLRKIEIPHAHIIV